MRLFDTHAHYWDERFKNELGEGGTDALLDRLLTGEVPHIVNVGTSPATSRLAISQAARHPGMLTAVGIHPTDCQRLSDADAALSEIETLLLDPASRAVALGEIGLDYHYEDTEKEKQLFFFREQLAMAERLSMPVSVHDRDAHGDVLKTLTAFPGVRGILHSYSGSAESARELIEAGYYISFSGTVTFKNAARVRAVAAALPPERILIETDCPYLCPDPYRGTLNHSGRLPLILSALAELYGMSTEALGAQLYRNSLRAFSLPPED